MGIGRVTFSSRGLCLAYGKYPKYQDLPSGHDGFKTILLYVLMWDKEIPPEDRKNSSEMRFCRISYEIIQVRGWNFLVPYQYFFSPTL